MTWSSFLKGMREDPVPGIAPNRPARRAEDWLDQRDPLFDLVFVEFDDQGRPFDPTAIGRAMDHIHAVGTTADPFVIVFVHGWLHSARDDDDNLVNFRRLLHANAHTEQLSPQPVRRRVVGLYVGWRGKSLHWLGVVQNLTFWGRKEAALRVALGSVRELFARLRQYRLGDDVGGKPTDRRLVIVGHSFGGLIVYSAIAEYLIESISVPYEEVEPVAPFGDLAVLVNPAFEASRYYPLHSVVARRRFPQGQPPVFISVTSTNDQATGLAFPLGRMLTLWTGRSLGARERTAKLDTMGHVLWMQTHEMTLEPAALPIAPMTLADTDPLGDEARRARMAKEDTDYQSFVAEAADPQGYLLPGWTRRYSSGAILRQTRPEPEPGDTGIVPDNPFWSIRASPDLIDGHGGIFRYVFLDALRQILDDTIRARTAAKVR